MTPEVIATRKATYPTVVGGTGDEPDIIISTVGVDRDGDVLQPEG